MKTPIRYAGGKSKHTTLSLNTYLNSRILRESFHHLLVEVRLNLGGHLRLVLK